jgi:hypothetical protein
MDYPTIWKTAQLDVLYCGTIQLKKAKNNLYKITPKRQNISPVFWSQETRTTKIEKRGETICNLIDVLLTVINE